MNVEVITKDDLQNFRVALFNDLKELLKPLAQTKKHWLRTSEVRKLLQISAGTIQKLRISGLLKSSKIGGIHYYLYEDIEKLLKEDLYKQKQ